MAYTELGRILKLNRARYRIFCTNEHEGCRKNLYGCVINELPPGSGKIQNWNWTPRRRREKEVKAIVIVNSFFLVRQPDTITKIWFHGFGEERATENVRIVFFASRSNETFALSVGLGDKVHLIILDDGGARVPPSRRFARFVQMREDTRRARVPLID